MTTDTLTVSWQRIVIAWLVHIFTASSAVLGLLALGAIQQEKFTIAFWLMGGTIAIDSVDGLIARWAKVKMLTPQIDGALLDNMVDYFTYVIVPAFFLMQSHLLSASWRYIAPSLIIFASAYQFSQSDAKTEDHFFKGFPSYWNIVVFYLFIWQLSPWFNLICLLTLVVLIFVPIKYVYPSRLDYLTPNPLLRRAMFIATLVWGFATLPLIWLYPETNRLLVGISMGYGVLYTVVSLYRTFVPAKMKRP